MIILALISSVFSNVLEFLGWFAYWVIGPIIAYILFGIVMGCLSLFKWKEDRDWAPRRGYRRKGGKWFE